MEKIDKKFYKQQLEFLSDNKFEKWLVENNIKLFPYQKRFVLDIFRLKSLSWKYKNIDNTLYLPVNNISHSFKGLGSGLSYAFYIAEKFIKRRE